MMEHRASETGAALASPRATSASATVNPGNQTQITTAENSDDVLAAEEVTDDAGSVAHESIASSTTSVTESVLQYREENGRTYHNRNAGYALPNDDRENERLDLQHNMFIRTFDERLGTAPPNDEGAQVRRVLDVGTGSGIWAMDFGDEHPEAEVLGVDLSPVQPVFVPPNVQFEIDNVNEPWTYSESFDYIHSRLMNGSVLDWKAFVKQCYDNLEPGGYLELNEGDIAPVCDDDTLPADCSLMKSVRLWHQALGIFGTPFKPSDRLKDVLVEVGFEDVHIKRFKWPTCGWPKDRKYKELGIWNYENLAPHWDGILMGALTRGLGWTREEVLVLAMEARKDFRDRNIHAYFNM
ncbi:methyltransferase domain-containing protein [Colletotrichum karsti]|uniref:Methyltransferase domain-containing protein n=1 Tax=Colletotrichum karsti TaxID=1095194 RepID=A0A9P6I8D6_9PEZI|nr:methyltransferase domain-containing protein [Colletotrichum karsti]KAF9877854.1 methyltransferase domain-containing protein [Colletotrichum karsti]